MEVHVLTDGLNEYGFHSLNSKDSVITSLTMILNYTAGTFLMSLLFKESLCVTAMSIRSLADGFGCSVL